MKKAEDIVIGDKIYCLYESQFSLYGTVVDVRKDGTIYKFKLDDTFMNTYISMPENSYFNSPSINFICSNDSEVEALNKLFCIVRKDTVASIACGFNRLFDGYFKTEND